ncbi:YbjN domain-containing protein [Rhodococcus sp. HNM0569]|uniref:YbjN domain-containing protein n=1 Tax=Rhodococcus sp. HNM0569 TaxID=2716340 RepID=UPI001469A295|nr:YbjN domain-containing protein [Rhodococcus sp. HNM0569]NLU85031.1 hypothetical protein [Rhodococcus sp. HNM0569]
MTGAADDLLVRTADALRVFTQVDTADDGSLRFDYAGALCSLNAMTLTDGLDVVSLTCVLAWDRPASAALHKRVAARNDELQFGTVVAFTRGRTVDVVLRYAFPASGLDDTALTTMLLLVLSGAETAREGLVP